MDGSNKKSGAFEFLEVKPLKPKPRLEAVTIANDRRLSHQQVRSLVEVAGDTLDFIKMPDHYGLISRYSVDWLNEKIAIYHAGNILTTLGGALYEVAVVQGRVREFFQRASEIGFAGVEVSEDIVEPGDPLVRAEHIRMAVDLGMHVFSEIGRKFPDTPFNPVESAEIAMRDLEAGAHMIVFENSDIVQIMAEKGSGVHDFVKLMPFNRLIFEAGPNDRMAVVRWLFSEFGSRTNIENIEIEDAGAIAAMREGLHRNVDFCYFDNMKT
ncbi:MAG: phosphosulfolactate synthase [Pseudorhodobacter sp.]|nr:phosphosulfolactate synthase [Pseudorhodobacter sp.]